MKPDNWTIKRLLEWSAGYFCKHSIETARLDAEVLLAHTLNINRLYLYLDINRPLLPDELKKYKEVIKRRVAREPVAYITCSREFWSLKFKVNSEALIPRPETEILVNAALDILKKSDCNKNINVADIGTGCGNIAISLVKEGLAKGLPEIKLIAADFSKGAIAMAIDNAMAHNVRERIEFMCSDLFESFKKGNRFDLIVSNPPYIPSDEIGRLAPEIRYEPVQALDGGIDGLKYIRDIIKCSHEFLKENGCLAIEIGSMQADKVRKIVKGSYKNAVVSIIKDYSGNDRVAVVCGIKNIHP